MKPKSLTRYSHVILIGSPVHFVGELSSEYFHLSHAWPLYHREMAEANPESPLFHAFFTISFENAAKASDREKFVALPDFTTVGDFFSVFLSAFFGKKFRNYGFLQTNGHYCIPDFAEIEPCRSRNTLPLNSKPRKDLAIDLNFHHAESLRPIFDSIFLEIDNGQRVSDDLELAFTAGRFYLEALNFFHTDPEMAYLNLVNAGEVLVSKLTYSEEDLFDEDFRKFLNEIEGKMGKKAMEKVRSRLFQVRRKFRIGLSRLISQPFFDGHECKESGFAIIRENFESRMTAAYDLRSQFLHTGTRFGNWATILQQLNSEIGARPAYGSTEWKELIHRMPSLIGLERVIRFCLLRFIHQRVAPIHPKLE